MCVCLVVSASNRTCTATSSRNRTCFRAAKLRACLQTSVHQIYLHPCRHTDACARCAAAAAAAVPHLSIPSHVKSKHIRVCNRSMRKHMPIGIHIIYVYRHRHMTRSFTSTGLHEQSPLPGSYLQDRPVADWRPFESLASSVRLCLFSGAFGIGATVWREHCFRACYEPIDTTLRGGLSSGTPDTHSSAKIKRPC